MQLSDRGIRLALETAGLNIEPFVPEHLQPASYDLTLAGRFLVPVPRRQMLDLLLKEQPAYGILDLGLWAKFLLEPGHFVLASTVEHITLPDTISAKVEGRSSFGRAGVTIHQTAGFIDPGFSGNITLEVKLDERAPQPVLLTVGMRFAQVCFTRLDQPAERPYGSPGLGSTYVGARARGTVGAYGVLECAVCGRDVSTFHRHGLGPYATPPEGHHATQETPATRQ